MVLLHKINKKAYNVNKHANQHKWDIVHEEGREEIGLWREKRLRVRGARKTYHEFLVYSFDLDILKSFFQNINFMVVIQMIIAIIAVYIFQTFKISFDVHVSLFVSPIVFPLAFSINTDFQRREKVLEDLAVFKSSGMVWYFCMREWKQAAELDTDWITAVHGKLKSLLFHLREYLLTCKHERRKIILRAMYEDFSDTNQLIEKVRASKLPSNTAIISRSVHLLNMMCLSFERLRVIREYRSPRSIRSFNKVFIMFLPIILSPYFVFLGIKSNNTWEPYYIAVLVAFVFSALQGVQDKLDDPFDGMSEDDIDLDTIDEWTFGSLEHTMKRTFDVGRFKVTVDPNNDPKEFQSPIFQRETGGGDNVLRPQTTSTYTVPLLRTNTKDYSNVKEDHVDIQKFAPLLEGMKGNTRINRKSIYRRSSMQSEDNSSDGSERLETIFEPISITDVNNFQGQPDKKVSFSNEPIISPDTVSNFIAYQCEEVNDSKAPLIQESPASVRSLKCFPEQEFLQHSSITDRLCSHSDDNIPFDLSTHGNQRNVSDLCIDKRKSWVETRNIRSDNTGSSNTCSSTPIGNKFCVKPVENRINNLQENIPGMDKSKVDNKEIDSSDFTGKHVKPKVKFNVVSVDKQDINMTDVSKNDSHDDNVKGVRDVIKDREKSYHEDDVNNIFLDNRNSLLLKYPDSTPVVEFPKSSSQSSEELNIPSVSFLDGSNNVNNKSVDIPVNNVSRSTQTPTDPYITDSITNSKGVLGYLGNVKDKMNVYSPGAMSSDFVNTATYLDNDDNEIKRQITSPF